MKNSRDFSEDRIMEIQIRNALKKAWKKTLRQLENEPARIIIESGNAVVDISAQTADEIMAWLFKGSDGNDSSGTGN